MLKQRPNNAQLLELYALYKQATVGDVNTAQPWAVQMEARAKWDAWNSKKGQHARTAHSSVLPQVDLSLPRLAAGLLAAVLLAPVCSGRTVHRGSEGSVREACQRADRLGWVEHKEQQRQLIVDPLQDCGTEGNALRVQRSSATVCSIDRRRSRCCRRVLRPSSVSSPAVLSAPAPFLYLMVLSSLQGWASLPSAPSAVPPARHYRCRCCCYYWRCSRALRAAWPSPPSPLRS